MMIEKGAVVEAYGSGQHEQLTITVLLSSLRDSDEDEM